MQDTNLNTQPYFDDFDADKSFQRILFQPAAVQAREMNQMQSILMKQIERFGNHMFTEGAEVIPGGVRVILNQDQVSLDFSAGSAYSDIQDRDNLSIRSASGLVANVAKTHPAAGSDKTVLFIDYQTSGSSQEKKFAPGETCTISTVIAGVSTDIATVVISAVGQGSWAKVQNGVYYVRGMFIETPDQDTLISKFSTTPTARIGFNVTEAIIDSSMDESLLSNATGEPNFKAPGADRLKITLTLTTSDIISIDRNFIELARVDNGNLQFKVDGTNYSVIQKTLAQRTYETNGDYTVVDFGVDLKEHLNINDNGGAYTPAQGGDEAKFVAMMKPGIGYIKGYRNENIGNVNIAIDKARDTALLNNGVVAAEYGSYIMLKNLHSLPDIDVKKKILFRTTLGATIGYCRARAIRSDAAGKVRLYIFDINFDNLQSMGDAKTIRYTDADNLFTAELDTSVLYNANKNALYFKMPVDAVKTLLGEGGVSDISYTVTRTYNVITNSSGLATIAVGANESFAPIDSTYLLASTGVANDGTLYDAESSVSLGGAPLGSILNINLGSSNASKNIKVIAPVIKLSSTQKVKTLKTAVDEHVVFNNASIKNLAKADIVRILSIKDAETLEELKSAFVVDNGQRANWYQVGSISTGGGNITREVLVTYQYFDHSAGDYFTIDSYGGMDRLSIPMLGETSMADYIDFRPLKNAAGDFTSATVFGEIIRANDFIRADVVYYLPRWDVIYIDSEGTFDRVKGVPSNKPTIPKIPNNAMKLYDLYIPAYTGKLSEVFYFKTDNKRYTMRDIGKLDTRIKNLEYYTTLSSLEAKTNSTQVLDPITGNNRFKNGFAVDGFTDFRLCDTTSQEWSASMDLNFGLLNPQFMENGSDFDILASSSNVTKRTSVYVKSYTEEAIITQPYATQTCNINPYGVFAWVGDITLTPSQDFWKDVKYIEPVVVNNVLNLRGDAVQGSVWTAWEQTTEANRLGGHAAWATLQRISKLVQTTFTETTKQTQEDVVAQTRIIPFMRSIELKFLCSGFRPFTRIYPFFDSISVAAECKPLNGEYGDAIVTDETGSVEGVYLVPNRDDKRFPTGTSVLRFTDSEIDSRDPNILTTQGSVKFESGGEAVDRQIVTTNNIVQSFSQGVIAVQYIDPIAQTFMVPTNGGAFISKVDIFFNTKAKTIPVTLELRRVTAGLPTNEIIAISTVKAADVLISDDATVATEFVFNDPIYLNDLQEFAIVLRADTQEYEVFVAEMGKNVIGQDLSLAKQPNMGVFLTSSNGSTWNPNQLMDMKFTLHRAVFDTQSPSVLVLNGKDPIGLPVAFNSIRTVSGSNQLTVKMKSHGLKAGDTLVISGAVGGNGISTGSLNATQTVITSNIDEFTIQAPVNATETGSIGGSLMLVKANYPFTTFFANTSAVDFNDTNILWEYRYKQQSSRAFTNWANFDTNKSVYVDKEGVMIAGSDFQIRATMTTTKDNLTPCIEGSGLTTLFISPRINNDFSKPVFSYVTQPIMFDNPCTSAVYYIGANLPSGANMKVFYKPINSADQDLSTVAWVEVSSTKPIVNDQNEYLEYTYNIDNVGSFSGYQVKIVLVGSDPVAYPSLSDFRSIALA